VKTWFITSASRGFGSILAEAAFTRGARVLGKRIIIRVADAKTKRL
jgi:hypothetical protein